MWAEARRRTVLWSRTDSGSSLRCFDGIVFFSLLRSTPLNKTLLPLACLFLLLNPRKSAECWCFNSQRLESTWAFISLFVSYSRPHTCRPKSNHLSLAVIRMQRFLMTSNMHFSMIQFSGDLFGVNSFQLIVLDAETWLTPISDVISSVIYRKLFRIRWSTCSLSPTGVIVNGLI